MVRTVAGYLGLMPSSGRSRNPASTPRASPERRLSPAWVRGMYSGSMEDSVADVLAVLGDRWALRVVRDVALGHRRFDELAERTSAPRTVLSDRLRRLVDADILTTRTYQVPGRRTQREYVLTSAGIDLMPVLAALSD